MKAIEQALSKIRIVEKNIAKSLNKVRILERKKYHPLVHKVHKKHRISKKTLFYIKEYGSHSNVPLTIIRESIGILLFASIISSLGGLSIEYTKAIFISITPLLILLPALNDMIGDYGTIVSSRFSTMLYEGKIGVRWKRDKDFRKLLKQVLIISLLTSILASAIALAISYISGFSMDAGFIAKIFAIVIIDVLIIVSLLVVISIVLGLYFFRKQEDPNNFLIPITTSIADFANMLLLSLLVVLFF